MCGELFTSGLHETHLSFSFASSASVAVAGNNVYVVWQDNRDGNDEIYFKYSLDNGATWSDDARLTNNRAVSKSPSLATDTPGNLYIIWTDKRDGKSGIYFRKGELVGSQ